MQAGRQRITAGPLAAVRARDSIVPKANARRSDSIVFDRGSPDVGAFLRRRRPA